MATTRASPSSRPSPSSKRWNSPSEPTTAGGAQGLARSARPGRLGYPWLEWRRGVAGVPHGAEGIDEARSPREVECDEFRHWQ